MSRRREISCLNCSTKRIVAMSDIKRGGGKFCSNKCSVVYTAPERGKKISGDPKKRFFSNIIREKEWKKCWVWLGLKSRQGYGRMTINKKQKLAHRYSWEIYRGQIPDGMFICHKCDNPSCVNPRHLFVGDRFDNAKDMVKKGRNRDDKGSKHPSAKLTEEQVIHIRKRIEDGEMQINLAKEFNVHKATISMIKRRENWSHV